MSSDPRLLDFADDFAAKRSFPRSRSWRVEAGPSTYHSDLLWPPHAPRACEPARTDGAAESTEPAKLDTSGMLARRRLNCGNHEIVLDTARAYEMLSASASVNVPLLCLATKG